MEAAFMENISNKLKQLEFTKALHNKIAKENEILQEELQVLEKFAKAKELHQYCNEDSNILSEQQSIISYMQIEINQLDYLQNLLSDELRKKQQLTNELVTSRKQYDDQFQMLTGYKNGEVDRAIKMARNNVETIKLQLQAEYRSVSDEVDNARRQLEIMSEEKVREKDQVFQEIYKNQQDNANLLNYVSEENKRYIELSKQKNNPVFQAVVKINSPAKTKKFKKSHVLEEPKNEQMEVNTGEKGPSVVRKTRRLFNIEEHMKSLHDMCRNQRNLE